MSSEHDHIVQLKKRKSNISKLYNEAIGTSMDEFSQRKLPQYRQILQRYRSFRSQSHNVGVAYVAKCISCELIKICELTPIPHRSMKFCSSVHRFIEGQNKIGAEIRLKPEEQNKLDKLPRTYVLTARYVIIEENIRPLVGLKTLTSTVLYHT